MVTVEVTTVGNQVINIETTNDVIWGHWSNELPHQLNQTLTGTSTVISTANTVNAQNQQIWLQWVQNAIATTTGTFATGQSVNVTARVWNTWNQDYVAKRWVIEDQFNRHVNTEQDRLNREQREREWAAQAERERMANAEAKAKAERLLQSALTDKERTELKERGYFTCRSKKGNAYRIYRGSHGNVRRLDVALHKEIERLCVQPPAVPEGDCMLAQKLHIENDEDGFRQTANITKLTN